MKSLNLLYKISMFVALVGWIVLIGFPKADFTNSFVTYVIVSLLSGIYAYLIFVQKTPKTGERYPKGNFKNIQGLANFFKNPKVVLLGWVHLLAFDLMVGLYIKNDALANGFSFWWGIPSLILTCCFGPLGLLSYFLLRFFLLL